MPRRYRAAEPPTHFIEVVKGENGYEAVEYAPHAALSRHFSTKPVRLSYADFCTAYAWSQLRLQTVGAKPPVMWLGRARDGVRLYFCQIVKRSVENLGKGEAAGIVQVSNLVVRVKAGSSKVTPKHG